MTITHTYTYAVLEISAEAYDEIKRKLELLDYEDKFHQDSYYGIVIDMHGIALAKTKDSKECKKAYNSDQVLTILQERIKRCGSQERFARMYNIPRSTIATAVNRGSIGEAVLSALGMYKTDVYYFRD